MLVAAASTGTRIPAGDGTAPCALGTLAVGLVPSAITDTVAWTGVPCACSGVIVRMRLPPLWNTENTSRPVSRATLSVGEFAVMPLTPVEVQIGRAHV